MRSLSAGRDLWVPGAVAALLVGAFLALPIAGTDLSAAVARADFASRHALAPVDFAWFGGTNQFGYSLISQFITAAVGVRLTGALAALAACLCFAALLRQGRVVHPVAGSVVGSFCIVANLVSGRISFAIGVAFGLGALLALTSRNRRLGYVVAAVLALLCAAASPVAGLFAMLCGVALLITHRIAAGALLVVATALPMAVIGLLFGQGGWMQMTPADAITGTIICLIVAGLVAVKPVRIGAILCAAGIVAAYLVHTPVGANALRLPVMFALPLLVGLVDRSRWIVALGAVAVVALHPPIVAGDLLGAGDQASYEAYYAPLASELAKLPDTGKVEVVMTPDYWESAYIARDHLLARGWLRQQDTHQNPLFFEDSVPRPAYEEWLLRNGVSYVALPGELSWLGERERTVVELTASDRGPGSLTPIWANRNWRLYRVNGSRGLVDGPAVVESTSPGAIQLRFRRPGTALVRINYSRWLAATGGACLEDAHGWVDVRARRPGPVVISSAFRPSRPSAC